MWKVVFHVDEAEKWPLVFGNIRNFLGSCDHGTAQVRVVVNAGAVQSVVRKDWQEEFQRLATQEVVFECCRIALKGHAIDVSGLPRELAVIPSGVRRLIELQQAGFAYIKP